MGRSHTAKRHRMWCRDCDAARKRTGDNSINPRYTLKRHPNDFKQTKRTWCPHCGSMNVRSDETNRRKEMAKKELCHCLPFPHKIGEIAGCEHWEGEVNPYDFEAMMNTPRGGG